MTGSLRDLIQEKKKFSEREAIKIMFKIVKIYYNSLYKKRVMHRDIKPGNILFNLLANGEYEFKLADFGIVKVVYTQKNTKLGTPEYVSPEQGPFGDGIYDSKTDIYPLGLIMF